MLKKHEYLKTVRRLYPPLYSSLTLIGISNYKNFKILINERFTFREFIKTNNIWYYPKKETEQGNKIVFEEWSKPEKLKQVKKTVPKMEKKLINATKSTFVKLCEGYESYMPALVLVWMADKPVEIRIKQLLSEKLPEEEAEHILNQLNIPLQDNFYKKEEYDLITTKNLKEHVKKYEWLHSRYGEKIPYTVEEAKEKLSKINKKEFLKKQKEEKTKIKKAVNKAKKILGKKNNSIVDFLQFIVYYRTQRTDIMNKSAYLFAPKLEKIAKEKGLTYEQILYCTKDEILNKIPTIQIIKERIKDHTMIMEDGKIRCLHGEESRKIKEYFEEKITNVKELKGEIACKGIVRGKVKLILDRKDFNKVNHGDIIVTSMTTPEMVPIMKKASAFITNEGGITCHAAIISREMKKPCIINTNNATEVLKDNDLIEVNANKGIIKIIK